jgi:hypothetical protein
MPRREPGSPIPLPSIRPMSSSEARKIAGPQAPSLLKPNLGLPEVPTDPGLLRNPRYAELPAQAFEKGQDPEKYIQAGKAIEQQKQQAQQRQSQTNYGRATQNQAKEPEAYDWQELPSGAQRKVPAAPYAIRREDPSTVLSQNAQIARMKVALTPEQRAAQVTGKAPPLFAKPATGTTPLNTQQQKDVLTKWQMGAKTPQEKEIRGRVAAEARATDFGRNPAGNPAYINKIKAQRQADFDAWNRGDPGSVGRFGAPVRRPLENIDLYTKKEVGFEPGLADKVSSKVGFDVLSSKARTADVLRQSKTAEVSYDAAKRAAERLKKPLFKEQVEPNIKFKNNNSLMESIYNAITRKLS